MFLGLWAALLLGVDPQVIQLMATGAGMPLWFLAAYLAAQLNIPLLARFHDRAPWLTLAVRWPPWWWPSTASAAPCRCSPTPTWCSCGAPCSSWAS